ncbi:MAG: hypothetical protein H7145_03685, partial [Akkermansiaceae bacterium]|nr:hypothetical protein [Armatimonadota bacterium]
MRTPGLMLTFAATVAALGFCQGCHRAGADGDGGEKTAAVPPPPPITVSRTAAVPEPLRAAAETLFAQGLADPMGGEYREITVRVGSVWGGESDVKTHGWVLPERVGEAARRAVCPNGLIYTVRAVGKNVRVRDDVAKYLQSREVVRKKYGGRAGIAWRDATPESESVSIESLSPLYICLLLRLGEDGPAASLYKEWEPSLRSRIDADDSSRVDPYYLLANRWAWALYDRAVCAHMRG